MSAAVFVLILVIEKLFVTFASTILEQNFSVVLTIATANCGTQRQVRKMIWDVTGIEFHILALYWGYA